MDHIDNLNNHTNILCCDYTKNTIYTMISFMLMTIMYASIQSII